MTKKERMQEYLRGYRERQEARVKLRKSYAAAETRTRSIVQPGFMAKADATYETPRTHAAHMEVRNV